MDFWAERVLVLLRPPRLALEGLGRFFFGGGGAFLAFGGGGGGAFLAFGGGGGGGGGGFFAMANASCKH